MRPYIILNCAMSLDAKIGAKERGEKKRIIFSNDLDKQRVRELRREVDGVMVGVNTILVDNPHLTTSEHKEYNPVRIVVDSAARTPLDAEVLDDRAKTIIIVSKKAPLDKIKRFSEKAEILVSGSNKVDLEDALSVLYKTGIKKLLLEGGGTLNRSMLSVGFVDELFVMIAPVIIGDGVNLIEGELVRGISLSLKGIRQYRDQVILHYLIK